MLAKDCGLTSIGFYLRSLRAIINLPGNKKLFTEDTYPFGRHKYIIPTGPSSKKALGPEEIKALYDYNPEAKAPDTDSELFARDMWFFGFFANGINPKDIANLKFENIDNGIIKILRSKTKFTTRHAPRWIVIIVNSDMERIIDKWGNKDCSAKNYVFPILSPGLSAHRQRELTQNFTRFINNWMNRICEKVGIKTRIGTMEYRHSMATTLKYSGVNTVFIQEIMGHTDVKTTEAYLAGFDLETKRKYARHLVSFKDLSSTQGK